MWPAHFICVLLLGAGFAAPASAGVLAPSADPVATFIAVADSVARAPGEAGLASFVFDNSILVGATVAKLLDVAFQVSQGGDVVAANENVAFARKIAVAHEANGGSAVARGLVVAYEKWTPEQRQIRARAMTLEEESVAARKANDIPTAVSLLNQARTLYEKIGDAHSVAVNWGTMGVTHFAAGDWAAVIADYDRALVARRAVEDRILEGRTLNGLGSAYQQQGNYDPSIEYYDQAIALREKTGDLSGLGTSLTFLGHAYNRSGRYVQARDCYEKALPILEALGSPQQMVEILSGVALLNLEMGRTNDAEAAYRRAIDIAQHDGLANPEATLRRNLADNLRLQGRYAEALSNLDAAWILLEANPDPAEQALVLSTRGTTYMNMGEMESARADFVRFSELTKELDNPAYSALAERNTAYFYRESGAYERGLKSVQEAIALAEKAGDAREYREGLVLRGDLEMRLGRYEDSLKSWEEALAQDTQDQAVKAVLEDEIAIASVQASMGKTRAARERLRGVRARAAGLPHLETAAMFAMGQSFEKENADSAAFYYDRALGQLEAEGAGLGGAEVQAGFLSGVRRYYYEEVTRYFVSTYESTRDVRWSKRGFATIEKAKARGLLDLLRVTVADRSSPEEEKLLDRLYSLDPKSASYATDRDAIERRYVDVRRARVESAMGGLSGSTTPVDLDAVSRSLPGHTVLLEYALGDSASFLWVVDRDGHDIVRLPRRAAIEAEVRRLRDALARVRGGETALLKSARSLYETLLRPADARLEGAETVLIVPDGKLFELPFEALLSSDVVAEGDWRKQPFFARSHETLYAPSASVYLSMKSRPALKSYDRDLFAVGNPDFTGLAVERGEPLAPLPFAMQEIDAISAGVKDSRRIVLTGRDASEANVKDEFKNGTPRVVHLATHGLVDPTEPMRSNVALAAGDHEDGYFHTLEILAIPVRSQLVVMSACETARGQISRGEGVVGLSRAFLASGAGSVIASLWAVSDESTAELMKAFYKGMLGRKRSASRALNEARLALIDTEKYSHPFYWSPFVVTGTERSPW